MAGNLSHELENACCLIFEPAAEFSIEFLESLRPSQVNHAFRRKAFLIHPDRAAAIGINEYLLNERFKRLSRAYEKLLSAARNNQVLSGNHCTDAWKCHPGSGAAARREEREEVNSRKGPERKAGHYYRGGLPGWELRTGQMTYYSSLAPWGAFIDSLVWQRRQRPPLGQLAVEWKILTRQDVRELLQLKKSIERIGDCALRKGYVTDFELSALVGLQRRLQPRIGLYFVETGILSSSRIHDMVKNMKEHNRKVRRGKILKQCSP